MVERVANIAARSIDYRLRQLGVRVKERDCQLISFTRDKWVTLGPILELPVSLPQAMDELTSASTDSIQATAHQYMKECPGSDLADVLAKKLDFDAALNGPAPSLQAC